VGGKQGSYLNAFRLNQVMEPVEDRSILDKFCMEFCSLVEKHVKYIIVSGFVAIAAGRKRATEDIDVIIESLDKEKFIRLHGELIKNHFSCIQSDSANEVHSYLKDNLSVRYVRENNEPEMEVKFAKDVLDNLQIQGRIKIPLTGIDVWFGSIEMNIAYKEEYLKSDKDLEDAKHLRIVFDANEEKINKCKELIRKYR